jgi:hypothetical protein
VRKARVFFSTGANVVYGGEIRDLAVRFSINENRAFRLIEKWEAKGWYEMSSCPPGGWFTDTAPDHLDARMP